MIYLDNASTTKLTPEVFSAMEPFLKESYGNPSSHHSLGEKARKAIDESREIIASVINCKPQEIYFTSGGSEANTWAIKGLNHSGKRCFFISSKQEHHSILNALKTFSPYDVYYLDSDNYGVIDTESVRDKSFYGVTLCTIQTVNNETGIIQPIQKLAFKCKDDGCIFHTDAVQAFGYLKLDVDQLGVDMLSASAHKIHGPKGVGFLYISDRIKDQMCPLINGGQQERGLRGSTENVAGIVGFGRAALIANQNMSKNFEYTKNLGIEFVNMLSHLPGVHTNVNLTDTDFRHISIRLDGIRAEEMLALLDSVHICVSSGSACNSDSKEPSHVLKAIGLSDKEANSTIRVSLNETNTLQELKEFISYLEVFLTTLRRK